MNAITLHYYTIPRGEWDHKGSATGFSEEEFYSTLVRAQEIETIIKGHCDRIPMANLAQTVNVLQSVILTKNEEMVLTPTYHVFDLYQAHQGAKEIDCFVQSKQIGVDEWKIGQITASASEKDGVTTVTMANLSADKEAEVTLQGIPVQEVRGRILTGDMNQYNDFGCNRLSVEKFSDFQLKENEVIIALPACSVLEIKIQ